MSVLHSSSASICGQGEENRGLITWGKEGKEIRVGHQQNGFTVSLHSQYVCENESEISLCVLIRHGYSYWSFRYELSEEGCYEFRSFQFCPCVSHLGDWHLDPTTLWIDHDDKHFFELGSALVDPLSNSISRRLGEYKSQQKCS